MNDRALFIATMRKPEMRLLRAALYDLKWEHNIEWSTLTIMEIEWFGNPNNYDCWMLITDQHLSVCYDPQEATPYFYVSRIHDADNPSCTCEFCTVGRILAQPINA